MCDPQGIELAEKYFGGARGWHDKRKTRRRPIFSWYLSSENNIRPFLEAIAPYVRVKSEQVRLAMEWFETFHEFRGGRGLGRTMLQFPIHLDARRRKLVEMLRQEKVKLYV